MSYISNQTWREEIADRIQKTQRLDRIINFLSECDSELTRIEQFLNTEPNNPILHFDISCLRHARDHILDAHTAELQKQAIINALSEVF